MGLQPVTSPQKDSICFALQADSSLRLFSTGEVQISDTQSFAE